jgi:serine-type D-Ala-D-Ala carboxypeptidase/endopeptidase (penicillin-binding protein 4)
MKFLAFNFLNTRVAFAALVGILLLNSQPLRAQSAGNGILETAIKTLGQDADLRYGEVGITVVDVQTGQILGWWNGDKSLIPASNMKIVSTAAGLGILGNNFRFRTDLQTDGTIRDSVLYGNLYIKGYGDPTLGSAEIAGNTNFQQILDSFTVKTRALGIRKITGHIIGDGSALDVETAVPTWLWEDLGNYYGAGASGLNINENFYELVFGQNANLGSPPSVVRYEPHVPNFTLANHVQSAAGGGDNSYIFSTPYAPTGWVSGTIPAGSGYFNVRGAVPDPPLLAAWHLRKNLIAHGIEVVDSATTQFIREQRGADMPQRTTFFTWNSLPLSEIVRHGNLESVNLYCEAITRAIALKQTSNGSNDRGVEEITKFWAARGINTQGLFMQDGSGLSPRNGVTAFQLAQILRSIATDTTLFADFYASLPEAGKTGTMKGMFKNNLSVSGKLRAKSGTITRVKAYSGYVTTADGRLIAFSAILNNFTCKSREATKKLEQFMVELCRL